MNKEKMDDTVMVMVPLSIGMLTRLNAYMKEEGWQDGVSHYISKMVGNKLEERRLCKELLSEFEQSLQQNSSKVVPLRPHIKIAMYETE